MQDLLQCAGFSHPPDQCGAFPVRGDPVPTDLSADLHGWLQTVGALVPVLNDGLQDTVIIKIKLDTIITYHAPALTVKGSHGSLPAYKEDAVEMEGPSPSTSRTDDQFIQSSNIQFWLNFPFQVKLKKV